MPVRREHTSADTAPQAAESAPEPTASDATREGEAAATPPTPPATVAAATDTTATVAPAATADVAPQEAIVGMRKDQYLIVSKRGLLPQGVEPLSLGVLEQRVKDDPSIDYVKTLPGPQGLLGTLSADGGEPLSVVVAQMTEDRAAGLKQLPQLVVEADRPLSMTEPVMAGAFVARDPGVLTPAGAEFTATIIVKGTGGAPVEADVYLMGSMWPAQGVTDANGQVRLTLYGETPATLQGLYVKPKRDYWSLWISRPALDPTGNNAVHLAPLSQTFPDFPDHAATGWGIKAMKLDQLPAGHRGGGVRVAVVDSGIAATTHRNLLHTVKAGYDIGASNDQTWNQDSVMHGSHCAGVIAGRDAAGGVRGIAPDATMFAFKIFPGGRYSDLIEALDRCIEQQVDIANLSLGSSEKSQLLEQKIQQAKQLGVACIVAAGNSGGPVQFPASSANVLAVAAIGKQGTFPSGSYHTETVLVGDGIEASAEGYFPAKFSCFGAEVDVCAPGVAILSTVPPDNFAVWDGTSMAGPHVAGLAALVLAHHPDFQPQGRFAGRNAQRVERLFQLIKESAQPLNFGDPHRTGAGLPDAVKALGASGTVAVATVGMTALPDDLLQRLLALLQPPRAQPQGGTPPSPPIATSAAGAQNGTHVLAPASAGPVFAANVGATPVPAVSEGGGSQSPMAQLRALMRQAHLLEGADAIAPQSDVPVGGTATPATQAPTVEPLAQLTGLMRQSGLLPR